MQSDSEIISRTHNKDAAEINKVCKKPLGGFDPRLRLHAGKEFHPGFKSDDNVSLALGLNEYRFAFGFR